MWKRTLGGVSGTSDLPALIPSRPFRTNEGTTLQSEGRNGYKEHVEQREIRANYKKKHPGCWWGGKPCCKRPCVVRTTTPKSECSFHRSVLFSKLPFRPHRTPIQSPNRTPRLAQTRKRPTQRAGRCCANRSSAIRNNACTTSPTVALYLSLR